MKLVLDTNIVLDLFVFRDEAVAALHGDLASKKVQWLASRPMREELECVLSYEQLGPRMNAAQVSPQQVLEACDAHAQLVECAPA
jgi:predicted nucleic acid-binding protein